MTAEQEAPSIASSSGDATSAPAAWLGAQLSQVDPLIAKQFNLGGQRGALVVGVGIGSPAMRDGLAPGDVIVSFDGSPLAPLPKDRPLMVPGFFPGFDETARELVIRDVDPVLLDRANGLRTGDVLKSVQGVEVATIADFYRAVYRTDDPLVTLLVLRDGAAREAGIAALSLMNEEAREAWRSPAQASGDRLPLVSILDFRTDAVARSDMLIAVDVLGSALVNTERFRVLERSARDTLLKEIADSLSDAMDPERQLRVGRLLAADNVVIGSIARVEDRYVVSVKLVEVETGHAKAAVSGVYGSMSDLIDGSQALARDLVAAVR